MRIYVIVLILLLLMPVVLAAEKIQQVQTQQDDNTISVGKLIWNIIKYPLLILLIIIVLGFVIAKLILWIISLIEKKDNEVQSLIEMKTGLARGQGASKYISNFLFKWQKNTKIYLIYRDSTETMFKEFMGFYHGHFIDNESILWMAFSRKPVHFLLWFVPKIVVIMCPQVNEIDMIHPEDVHKNLYSSQKLNISKIKVNFLETEILIEANYVDQVSHAVDLYIPIVTDKSLNFIDDTRQVNQIVENLILKKVQYDIINSYANNIKKAMEINVITKTKQRINDSEGQVE